VRHDSYFLGEEGFVEVRYIGWDLPYQIYGEKQLYTFDERQKLVDKRDADILLNTIVDGVRVFDKAKGDSSEI
jgi:hypothetical protein